MDKRLETMRNELKEMAIREAIKLWRLARRAEKHGVSKEVINDIREEGFIMNNTMTSYPDRLLEWNFKYKYKYAFKY